MLANVSARGGFISITGFYGIGTGRVHAQAKNVHMLTHAHRGMTTYSPAATAGPFRQTQVDNSTLRANLGQKEKVIESSITRGTSGSES